MEISNSNNQDKIAIVAVGYNRLKSIKRLLSSLLKANYPSNSIPLVISIDCSGDEKLYSFVRAYEWPFGDKHVIFHETRLGLKDHIFSCGDLSQHFYAIILLEDDLYVSPEFYNYSKSTVEKYYNIEQVAGISLYSHEFNGFAGLPFTPINNGSDVFAVQTVVSWGQCWTSIMWKTFKEWLANSEINFSDYDMPESIKTWERAWSKYFYAFILATDKYFIFPYVSLSTNFGDTGENNRKGSNTIFQTNLLNGNKKYNLTDFDNLVKYDVYFNLKGLQSVLNLAEEDLCVDFWGTNMNKMGKRYILTPFLLPHRVVRSFALKLRPIELNILYNIEGNGIFLYDTRNKKNIKIKKRLNTTQIEYFSRGLNLFWQYQNFERNLILIIKQIIRKSL